MTELLIVIPARGGSKRLLRKNLRPLAGRSLLQRTHDTVVAAGLATPCLLSTDDGEIAEVGKRLGWLVPFLRPAELATDDMPTLPVVMHALDWFAEARGGDPETVMVLQVTSPFRGSEPLHRGLTLLQSNAQAEAVVGVMDLHRRGEHVFVRDETGFLVSVCGNSGPKPVFTPNGALYLVRTAALRHHGTLFPPRTLPLVMDTVQSIDIDTELDWQMAEAVIEKGVGGETMDEQMPEQA